MIPYGKQTISEEDIQEIIHVLKSDFLTQGPVIGKFEKAVSDYCGAKYAVAVSNATAALHITCMAMGVMPGKRVWTSPNTFVASANCALYCGAEIDFVDIDPATFNISVKELEKKLIQAKKANLLPHVVIPVHFSGQSCEMEKIHELSDHFGFKVLEDASHAVGGKYKGKPIGSCEFSEAAVFSFHPVKIITTGEGGMVLTNNEELYNKLILLRSHGITRDKEVMTAKNEGSWYYEQLELGFNYRITDIQAALGCSQWKRLDEFVNKRRKISEYYSSALQNLPLVLPVQNQDSASSWHLYVIRLKTEEVKIGHKDFFEKLRQAGIGVNLHYIPVHLQPYYRKLGFKKGDFPEAEKYYSEAVSIPVYFGLKDEEMGYVAKTIRELLK